MDGVQLSQGYSLLFTIQFPGVPGTQLIDLRTEERLRVTKQVLKKSSLKTPETSKKLKTIFRDNHL